MIRLGSKGLIKEINELHVLSEIRSHPLLSRTDIAERTGLSLPTVSGIAARLLEAGLIEERQMGASTGGRPPVQLALRAEAGYVVGVKLTELSAIAVLTDLQANVMAQTSVDIVGASVVGTISAVVAAVETLTPAAGGRPVIGVGVGVAGVVDRLSGVIRHGTYSNWVDVDLGSALRARLGLEVVIDNDVNALVASQQWFGAGLGASHFIVVSLGRGVGLGMVLDGRLYRGAVGGAGEFGHVKVASGPACVCGGRGCLEALVGDGAICAEVSTLVGFPVDIAEAVALAASGDAGARRVFARAGTVLGTAVGNLVNLLNPELIVLAGEGMKARELLMPEFTAGLGTAIFDGLQSGLRVVVDEWDDMAWARGAASVLLGELFQPTLHDGQKDRPSLTARVSAR